VTFVLGTLLFTVFLIVVVLVTLVDLEIELPRDCPEACVAKAIMTNDDKAYLLINVFIISNI